METVDRFLDYIRGQKRYSARTVAIYGDVLKDFHEFADRLWEGESYTFSDPLKRSVIRDYQAYLLDERHLSPRTVNLHMSVLSSYCRFLVRRSLLASDPMPLVIRVKQSSRLPQFFRQDAMDHYLSQDNALSRRDFLLDMQTERERRETYSSCLDRAIVAVLYSTGMRRAELLALDRGDVDWSRGVVKVLGKGDKMREIPLVACVKGEIELYLQAVSKLVPTAGNSPSDPLFVTFRGARIYPGVADSAVKKELSGKDFAGRRSPHVLRHSLATALMEDGADITSIKQVLGHANLAATQVYTHSSIKALKQVYNQTHPRSGVSAKEEK